MVRKRPQPKKLKRHVAWRPEKRRIIVFCEGRVSEPDYINGLKRLPRIRENAAVEVEIDPHPGTPLTLVKRAVERRRTDHDVDELWCVFDVEWPTAKRHPHLDQAMNLARDHGIRLAISNPCFELWLVLHFRDQHAFLETDAAERLSRECDGRKSGRQRDARKTKRIDVEQYMSRRAAACRRAAALDRKHRCGHTSFPDNNPSSTMHEFLAMLECDGEED